MALRFDLGPFEKLFIGKSVITNSHKRSLFAVDGSTPIMHGKDVLLLEAAQNALEKLYCCIQQIYLEEAPDKYQGAYLELRVKAVEEAPHLYPVIKDANNLIRNNDYYKVLKLLRQFIRQDAFLVDRDPSSNYVLGAEGWKKRA
jgi:flagellar protein FlbT